MFTPEVATRSVRQPRRWAIGAFVGDLACLSVAATAMWLGWQRGGVYPSDQLVALDLLCISVLLSLGGLLLRLGSRQGNYVPLVGIILLALLAWGVIQTSAFWKTAPPFVRDFAIGSGDSSGAGQGDQAISVAPVLSRLTCTHWAMVTAAFFIAANSFSSHRRRRWIWAVVLVNALALAAAGLGGRFGDMQSSIWSRSIFSFGPFYNRNNAVVWLILGMAAVWALLASVWLNADEESVFKGEESEAARWAGLGGVIQQVQDFIVSLRPSMILLIIAAVAIFTGACSSLSRAGIVSIAVAMAAPLFLRPKRIKSSWLLCVYGIIACGGVALGAMFYVFRGLEDRLTAAPMANVLDEPLFKHWEDCLVAIQNALPFGSGPGTYRYAYLPFQSRSPSGWYHHPENQYLEILMEGGYVAAALFLLLVVSAGIAIKKHVKSWSSDDVDLAIAGVIVMAGVSAQAVFDFGTSLLPNALLTAVLAGIILGNGSGQRFAGMGRGFDTSKLWIPTALLSLLAMLVVNRPLVAHDVAVDDLNDDVKSTLLVERGVPSKELDALLNRANSLSTAFEDFRTEQMVGELNLLAFRNRLFRNLTDPEHGLKEIEPGALWTSTSMLALCGMHSSDSPIAQGVLERVNRDATLVRHLDDARTAFARAKASCPMLPKVDLSIAAIDTIRQSGDAGASMLRAVKVAPAWPGQAFQAGLLAFMTGHEEIEHRAFGVAARHSESELVRVAEFYSRRQAFGKFVAEVLPDEPQMSATLLRSDSVVFSVDERHDLATAILSELGEPGSNEGPERHFARASAAGHLKRFPLALGEYRRTLELSPDWLDTRLEYARCLVDSGDCDAARVQLEILRHCTDQSITRLLPSLETRLQSCVGASVQR